MLKERAVLLSESQYEHSYPHCWRHKSPVMFVQRHNGSYHGKRSLLSKSLDSVNSIRWEPDWGQSRMESMLESRPDCVYLKRTWGVPIALLVHNETGEIHPKKFNY